MADSHPLSLYSPPLLMPTNTATGEVEVEVEDNGGGHSCHFTFMQLRELEQQSLIYTYIEKQIPIPTSLILPIWRSFPSSLVRTFYPNLLHLDIKSKVEAEPGRCRRTDGKKWRCAKLVAHGHKYCRAHLHRGRLRPNHHDRRTVANKGKHCSSLETSPETTNFCDGSG
ncbi:growth-regulating factor 10-like [Andrographis paniculata]|uniref:growth-regulating factor 10-like n=1 Tax=Andrographis paniculata TaxID=175694 RepID=UPI0021E72EBA|nr:growth-regulating factor 10-like [Andrographis paniculata]